MNQQRPTLTPEQSRALVVFEEAYQHFNDLLTTSNLSLESICITDTKIFTHQPLKTKNLPRGTDWLWNQSRSRQIVTLEDGTNVCFYKLNTRKARKAPGESPLYKLWVYNITLKSNQELSFLWCERGLCEVDEQIEVGELSDGEDPIEVCSVTLPELSFLRQFTTPLNASLFGWDQDETDDTSQNLIQDEPAADGE